MKLKSFLKKIYDKSPMARCIISVTYALSHFSPPCYSLIFSNLHLTFCGAFLRRTHFSIHGKQNVIVLGNKSRLNNCIIYINGNNCSLEIGEKAYIQNTTLYIEDDNSRIVIGEKSSMYGGQIAATEGKSIEIGNDCMFSTNIEIRNGDSHPIISQSDGRRINYAENVYVGNHVWIGANAKILKGGALPDNCIVGNSAIVNKRFTASGCIYAGIPAKIVKTDVTWTSQGRV